MQRKYMSKVSVTLFCIGFSASLSIPLAWGQTVSRPSGVVPSSSPAGVSSARVASSFALPRMGEAGALDLAAERELGDRIARDIFRDPDYLDDPVLGDYLQTIWQPLLVSAKERGDLPADLAERFAWTLMLARDRSINAFALPGGYLGVHLGLVATVTSADELASVLAHELSHVSQRHISRLIAKQDQQAPWIIGSMILGALVASASKNADLAQAAMVGGQAVAAQSQLDFSRDMEREADRIGHGVMTGAGFDGMGFVTMFDKLQQASRLNDDGSFPYLRSHPLTTERMADMKARLPAVASEKPGGRQPAGSSDLHAMMAARARVLAEPDTRRWQSWWQEGRAASTTDVGTLYAGAAAAWRLKQHADALQLAQRLLALPQLDAAARHAADLLLLEVWLTPQAGQVPGTTAAPKVSPGVAQSLAALSVQVLGAPDRASVLLGAQAAIQQGRAPEASQRLQLWVADHPNDALAWLTLSQTWSAQGQPLRAIRAEAESRMALLDIDGAVDRLRAARELGQRPGMTDHMELSIIDARYRQLVQRQREQASQERKS